MLSPVYPERRGAPKGEAERRRMATPVDPPGRHTDGVAAAAPASEFVLGALENGSFHRDAGEHLATSQNSIVGGQVT